MKIYLLQFNAFQKGRHELTNMGFENIIKFYDHEHIGMIWNRKRILSHDYGTDGDYFSKPNAEDVFNKVYEIMHESDPNKFPKIY